MDKTCKHFRGILGTDTCNAGINIINLVGGKNPGWLKKIPCTSRNKTKTLCNERKFPTDEEIKAEAEKLNEHVKAINKASELIKSKSLPRDRPHKIDCPLCNNTLTYVVASLNNHIRGRCATKDCLSWME